MIRPEFINTHCWLEHMKCWRWGTNSSHLLVQKVNFKDPLQGNQTVRDEYKRSDMRLYPYTEDVGDRKDAAVRDGR